MLYQDVNSVRSETQAGLQSPGAAAAGGEGEPDPEQGRPRRGGSCFKVTQLSYTTEGLYGIKADTKTHAFNHSATNTKSKAHFQKLVI